tara:strand:- start:5575 stop:5946 length:372 start_codon:yes stop_codon:yes gene_type:complete
MSNALISASSSVAVYQSWGLGHLAGDDLRHAARKEDLDTLRAMFRKLPNAAYYGSFDLARDMTLEELYGFLQNDNHPDGWVVATGAQEGWTGRELGAASLSMGDILQTEKGTFVVGMIGFIQL